MRILNIQEITNVTNLPPAKRYKYFINFICDSELAWGLYNEGWALGADVEDKVIFPLWPAAEFASLLTEGEWQGYYPKEISITELVEEMIPQLEEDNIELGIFYTINNKGIIVKPRELAHNMLNEITQYL